MAGSHHRVEEHEEDSDAVAARDVEGGVHVSEDEIVEALGAAAFAVSDARVRRKTNHRT